jgi:hypothetical protein
VFCRVGDLLTDKNLYWMKILEAVVENLEPSRRKVLSEVASYPTPQRGNAFSIFAPSCLEFSGPGSFPFTSFDLPFFE